MTDPHISSIEVRWVDMDAYRHVNNTVYLRYLEQARLEFLGFLGGFGEFGADVEPGPDAAPDDGMVIAELEIAYRRPLVFREQPVWVHSWITKIGNSSIGTRNVIRDDTHEYAVSTSRLVCIDRVGTRSRPIRSHERTFLQRYLVDA